MNKSVPTLLGIVIILLVVVLVVLVFNYKMTQQLGAGASVVGTVGGEALMGAKAPKEIITPPPPVPQGPMARRVSPAQSATPRTAETKEQRKAERQAEKKKMAETGAAGKAKGAATMPEAGK